MTVYLVAKISADISNYSEILYLFRKLVCTRAAVSTGSPAANESTLSTVPC